MRTKILLLFAILICVTFISNAQINAGRYLIGGSVSFNNSKTSEPLTTWKNQAFNSTLQFGKVVKENTVAGLILSYGYSKYINTNSADSNKGHYYNAGVFYRKYKRLAKDLYFFGQADVEYSHTEYMHQYIQTGLQGYKMVSNGVFASFVPGISYSICKRMQVELLMNDIIKLSYSHKKNDYNYGAAVSTQKQNELTFNTNLNSNLLSNFGIGFKFLLGK